MGERSEVSDGPSTEPQEAESGPTDAVSERSPSRTSRIVAFVAAGVLLVGAGITGGIVWAQQAAHDEALSDARAAYADAVAAVEARDAAVESLAQAGAAAAALRDSVATRVLPHQALLGGEQALAPLSASHSSLVTSLTDNFASDTDGAGEAGEPVVLDAPAEAKIPKLDADASTEQLVALQKKLTAEASKARASRLLVTARASEVTAAVVSVESSARTLASSVAATHEALVAARTLASADAKTAADAAVAELATADPAALAEKLEAYATAATAVIATHDAEAARIAAEEAAKKAAEEAKKKPKASGGKGSGGGGGGGGANNGVESSAVLTETNAHRSADGKGALVRNGTLVAAACAWASQLAAANGGLSHSSYPGGFSTWGENVAYGYGSASSVVTGWMGSPGHRANILNGGYTKMGACYADSATGKRYWAQQFGS